MRRSLAPFALCLLLLSPAARADGMDACIAAQVPKAAEVGRGRLNFLAWRVYDAALYAPGGNYSAGKPFGLTLTYNHSFTGAEIAKTSIDEMKRLGLDDADAIDRWLQQMQAIFPDVAKGDTLTGIALPHGPTIFCQGGRRIGSIKDPAFGPRFFAIWLDEKTKSPALRRNLLGVTNEKNPAHSAYGGRDDS